VSPSLLSAMFWAVDITDKKMLMYCWILRRVGPIVTVLPSKELNYRVV
jgi:hypothetical protein